MIQKLSQKQYAKKMQVSQPAISYRLANDLPLPGVVQVEKMSRFYILHFDTEAKIGAARNIFKKT